MRKLLLPLLIGLQLTASGASHTLWYSRPASLWVEALPLGNGRLGTMVFGNPAQEQLQLNEETIWAGQPNNNPNPNALEYLPGIREMVFAGKYAEAEQLATDKVMSQTNSGMPYQTFGDLRLTFPGHSQYTNYYRELSLDSATALVRYKVKGVEFQREIFTSFPDQVVVMRLTASRKKSISFSAILTSPHQDVKITTEVNDITLSGITPTHERLRGKVEFQGRVTARLRGGSMTVRDGVLAVEKADEVLIFVSIATNFRDYKTLDVDEVAKATELLRKAEKMDYRKARRAHIDFYKQFFDRSTLNLGEDVYSHLPTDERVEQFARISMVGETQSQTVAESLSTSNKKQGLDNQPGALLPDNHLVATYYQFGRYLLICSSQPGGQAANLQGIWNDKLFPPWDSKYTANINVEMNYWPAEVTNLSELFEPLLRLTREVSETGREAAKTMYGAGGWVMHHNTDIWRITGAVDRAPSGMWPSGGAWLCRHLYEHYLYTGNKEFLRSVYPILRESAVFFDEVMMHEPVHNWLVVNPSNSPENTHAGSNKKATIAAGVTMDNQLIFDLWNAVIESARVLDIRDELVPLLKEKIKLLPPMQTGRWGQLQEWMHDWDLQDDKHRHVSHLYGLYPGNQISPFRTPELFQAARNSLIARGDPSTGWSMGWKVCLWARLLDGDHAFKLITDQLTLVRDEPKRGGTYPNLFDAHPPFQIDGNFGCTAGIAEMLMQSHDGFVYLLPALPSGWKKGEVTGLVARGGFVIDMAWDNGAITKLKVYSRAGGVLRLKVAAPIKLALSGDKAAVDSRKSVQTAKLTDKASGTGALRVASGPNPNPLYVVPETPKPLISDLSYFKPLELSPSLLYDLDTEQGKSYLLKVVDEKAGDSSSITRADSVSSDKNKELGRVAEPRDVWSDATYFNFIPETAPWSERLALSEMDRFPEAWQIENARRPRWGYTHGLVVKAMQDLGSSVGSQKTKFYDYAKLNADSTIDSKGRIRMDFLSYNLDNVNPGKILFQLYRQEKDKRYKTAIDTLMKQLRQQPRTSQGGFWHKKKYEQQMWLDGLYMAAPFLAQYSAEFKDVKALDEALLQLQLIHQHTFEAATGLNFHGWDESRTQFWADKTTGLSKSFWSRSIGWYAMALVDVLDNVPGDHPQRKELIDRVKVLATALVKYQHPEKGVWYQVIDQGDRKVQLPAAGTGDKYQLQPAGSKSPTVRTSNYFESSASAMFLYFLSKSVRLKYIDEQFLTAIDKAQKGVISEFVIENERGFYDILNCCAVAGLGGDGTRRDGTFEYYISEPVIVNDPKSTGSMILAMLEVERLQVQHRGAINGD